MEMVRHDDPGVQGDRWPQPGYSLPFLRDDFTDRGQHDPILNDLAQASIPIPGADRDGVGASLPVVPACKVGRWDTGIGSYIGSTWRFLSADRRGSWREVETPSRYRNLS